MFIGNENNIAEKFPIPLFCFLQTDGHIALLILSGIAITTFENNS